MAIPERTYSAKIIFILKLHCDIIGNFNRIGSIVANLDRGDIEAISACHSVLSCFTGRRIDTRTVEADLHTADISCGNVCTAVCKYCHRPFNLCPAVGQANYVATPAIAKLKRKILGVIYVKCDVVICGDIFNIGHIELNIVPTLCLVKDYLQ